MTQDPSTTRRGFLSAAGTGAVAGLAGCSSNSSKEEKEPAQEQDPTGENLRRAAVAENQVDEYVSSEEELLDAELTVSKIDSFDISAANSNQVTQDAYEVSVDVETDGKLSEQESMEYISEIIREAADFNHGGLSSEFHDPSSSTPSEQAVYKLDVNLVSDGEEYASASYGGETPLQTGDLDELGNELMGEGSIEDVVEQAYSEAAGR
ncbi:MAG: twin-arginine translocation signal domain-containing protein [Candidatus Nanohaloarchaea archaeon]